MTLGYDIKSGEVTDSSGVIYNINTGEISVVIDGNVSNGSGSGGASNTYGLENLVGQVDENGVMRQPNPNSTTLIFTGVKDIESGLGGGQIWHSFSIKEAIFPDLETLSYQFGISQTFESCSKLVRAVFSKLREVSGRLACSRLFYSCANLEEALFDNLETASGDRCFDNAFCTWGSKFKRINFPKLKTITKSAFGSSAFSSQMEEIHFRADMQSVVEGLDSYASKFGATNATIYFDL